MVQFRSLYQSVDAAEKAFVLSLSHKPNAFEAYTFGNKETLAEGTATLFKPRLLFYTPWLDQHFTYFGINTEENHEVRNLFLESTLDKDFPEETPTLEVDVIYDPRVESPSREFMSQEAQMLPENVLSAFFKPYSNNDDLNTTSRDELAMIEKYEELQRRVAQEEKHHILDLDPQQQQKQAQAQVTHTLISDLNETSLEEERIFHSDYTQEKGETTEILGLIYEEPERDQEEAIYIQRDHELEAVKVVDPDKDASTGLKERINLLKIRQDYIASEDGTGKIIISLPIKLDTTLFTHHELSQIGNFRLYRTTHESEELTLVADRIQPKFWKYRERREISSQFVDYKGGDSLNINDEIFSEELKGYDIEVILDNGVKRFVFLYDLEKNALMGDDLKSLNPGKYSYSISLLSKKVYYLVEPYLYRDEIDVKNRSFELSDSSDRAFVDYYLEVMPMGENKNLEVKSDPDDPDLIFWNREYLYIPEKLSLPDEMGLVFSVKALDLNPPGEEVESEKGAFMILEGENLTPWNQNPDQFDIWVKEMPIQQTGFYAGDGDFAQLQSQKERPFIEDLGAESPLESSEGKHLLTIQFDSQKRCYKIRSEGIFRKDYSYRFYIGFKEGGSQKLLPMRHYLVKSFPKVWDQKPKLRAVDQIEWIPEGIYSQVSQREVDLYPLTQFFANGVYQFDKNFIATQFNCFDFNIGGVETFLIDQDEPGFIQRQLCEVQGESAFAESKTEFRESSAWQVPHWASLESCFYSKASSIFDASDQKFNPITTYYTAGSELVEELIKSIETLSERLEEPSYHWKEAYASALYFLKHLARFEKSPLNIDSPHTVKTTKKIKEGLIHLLLGTDPKVNLSSDSSDQRTHLESLLDILVELDKSLEEEDKVALSEEMWESARDRTYTRQLLLVIQRRLSVVNDLVASKPPEQLPDSRSSEDAGKANHLLPSLSQWMKILNEYQKDLSQEHLDECQGDLNECQKHLIGKHTKDLIKIFLDQNGEAIRERVQQTKRLIIAHLKDFKDYFNEEATDNAYLTALCRVIPLAKDIAIHLDRLSGQFQVQKNMHHSVNVDTIKTPHEPVKEIQLKAFIPDSLRLSEKKEVQIDEFYPSQNRFILPFFNLMEYLGFAVDISAVTEFQTHLHQDLLVKHLNETYDAESDTIPFILRGIAPNSTRFKEGLDAFAFVKIACLPKKLFTREKLQKALVINATGRQVTVQDAGDWDADACYVFEVQESENRYQTIQSTKIEKDGAQLTFTLSQKLDSSLDPSKITLYRYTLSALTELLSYRGIPSDQAVSYQKYFTAVAFLLDQFSRQAKANTIPEIYLEGVSKRWVTVPAKGGVSQAIWEVPDRLGHRYQVCMRALSRYEPLINWQIGRHDQVNLPDFEELILHSRLVRIKPIEYGWSRQNIEQMLLTYNYPHPSKAFFSYQLPVDAARAMKNQIASVRTGYKGCDLVFHHELIDHRDVKIAAILNAMKESNSAIKLPRIDGYDESLYRKVPSPQVRLFDHERLLTLTDLQYYHRFFMHVRTLYDSHTAPDKAPQTFPSISAITEPSNLYTFEQEVTQFIQGEDLIYHFTLYLSRHLDNLTQVELAKEPHSLTVAASPQNHEGHSGPTLHFAGHDVPDLTSVYHIFWRVDKQDGSDSYYVPVTSLHMPWSDDHGNTEAIFPRLRDTNSKFIIESVGPQVLGSFPPESESESRVPIEFTKIDKGSPEEYLAEKKFFQERTQDLNYQIPETFFAYKVRFSLKVAKKDSVDLGLYHDPSKFTLQLSRKQALAAKVNFKAEATIGVHS